MQFLRTHIASKIFTVFTAVVFLNMGFFLSEIKMFDLDLKKEMVENLAELILNIGMEEERDICEEIPDESGKTFTDFFHPLYQTTTSGFYPLVELRKCTHNCKVPPRSCSDKVTPPPKA